MMKRLALALVIGVFFTGLASARDYHPSIPPPSLSDVAYGPHERNVMDVWLAEGDGPRPLVFIIHGGGWSGGSKEVRIEQIVSIKDLLEAGISAVSINYRLIHRHPKNKNPDLDTNKHPPVHTPLSDIARALQFVRSKERKWNIDPSRVAASGASAGACSSLWLAFSDEMADPTSDDPIARESTRLHCATAYIAQTTLDPLQMKEWIPNSVYGGHAFGLNNFEAFLAAREQILPWIHRYSPYHNVSEDDPPVYLSYGRPSTPGQDDRDPTHSASFGIKLQEQCEKIGVTCELNLPGGKDSKHKTATDFLIQQLLDQP